MKEKLVEEENTSMNVDYIDKQETSATKAGLTKNLEKNHVMEPKKRKLY